MRDNIFKEGQEVTMSKGLRRGGRRRPGGEAASYVYGCSGLRSKRGVRRAVFARWTTAKGGVRHIKAGLFASMARHGVRDVKARDLLGTIVRGAKGANKLTATRAIIEIGAARIMRVTNSTVGC